MPLPGGSSSFSCSKKKHSSFSSATQTVNNDYNGFEGMEIDGKPSIVTVRGRVQVRDGKFVGDAARGEFLRRKPQHF